MSNTGKYLQVCLDAFSSPLAEIVVHVSAESICVDGKHGRIGYYACSLDYAAEVSVDLQFHR